MDEVQVQSLKPLKTLIISVCEFGPWRSVHGFYQIAIRIYGPQILGSATGVVWKV